MLNTVTLRKEKNIKNKKYNVEKLGQVYTPQNIVDIMLKLVKNKGRVLEPSCGDGAFSQYFPECVAIEIDNSKKPDYAICMDFIDYSVEEKFDTIIGNPPYVRYNDILSTTKKKLDMSLFDERSNLYLFFIHKCIQHLKPNGELIFIVPREFLKATSAIKLNECIYENGTITDLIDLGDTTVFSNYNPNCVIFRFEKGNFSRVTNKTRKFEIVNGQLLFTTNDYTTKFSDLFYVRVGGVSAADNCFTSENGNKEFVCSYTRQTGETRRMFYNIEVEELKPHKEKLLARRIKPFNEKNWYMWGRNFYESDEERIYVNCKTRQSNPFFYHECRNYDGAILAIFPKFECDLETLKQIVDELNQVDWNELGFMCDGRYLFSQKSLENTVLPKTFNKYLRSTTIQ